MATEDAAGYASDYGVSPSAAKDRLSYQESIGEAIADLRAGESDTFGGAWVEHSPTWQVVVRTTSGGPAAATIAGYFSGIPIQVTVRRDAPWSEQQTRTNAIASALDAVVDEHLVLYDPREPKGLVVTV